LLKESFALGDESRAAALMKTWPTTRSETPSIANPTADVLLSLEIPPQNLAHGWL
jgi:hypothetical protein